MGANIRLLTLGDFMRHDANLKVWCRACDHSGVLSTERVQRWYHCHRWNDHMDIIGAHLRCSVCRGRPGAIRPVPATMPLTFPEWMALESEWGKLVKRLRG
jgi:hypothetical protein